MGKVDPGKRFESRFRESLTELGLCVERIPDKVYWTGSRLVSEETSSDFCAWYAQCVDGKLRSFLVENKACSQHRLAYSRLKQHQHDALAEFDSMHADMHGFVAVNYYDPVSIANMDTCFMVPIGVWDEHAAGDMKSLSHEECLEDDRIILCQKVGRLYDMRPWLDSFNGK